MDQTRSGIVRAREANVEWVGEPRITADQHKHYKSFCKAETVITVNSFVLVLSEEEFHYIAYVKDLYEDRRGSKNAKVQWFQRYEEVKDRLPGVDPNGDEIYFNGSIELISVDTIDIIATILTPDYYEKFLALLDDTCEPLSTFGIYVCCKEIVDGAVKPFVVSQLPGYSDQSILSSLDIHKEPIRQSKRCRRANVVYSNSISEEHIIVNSSASNSIPEHPIDSELIEYAAFETFDRGDNVEVLYPGFHGCWIKCKISWKSRKHIVVEYHDDKRPEMQTIFPASGVAPPDELGMRWAGRKTIRPSPPPDAPNHIFKYGDGVDVCRNNNWCEGVVISTGDRHLVYLTDEKIFEKIEVKDLRVSRDWIERQWKEITPKLDIVSVISSMINTASSSNSGGVPPGHKRQGHRP